MIRAIKHLYRGNFRLFETFWLFGFAGSCVWSLIMYIPRHFMPEGDDFLNVKIMVVLLALYTIYLFIVSIGIWRSAGKYRGGLVWKVVARVHAATGVGVAVFLSGGIVYWRYGMV